MPRKKQNIETTPNPKKTPKKKAKKSVPEPVQEVIQEVVQEVVQEPVIETKPKKTRKKKLKKEKGCTEPLFGKKSKCIIKIVPKDKKVKTFQMDKKCIKRRKKTRKK